MVRLLAQRLRLFPVCSISSAGVNGLGVAAGSPPAPQPPKARRHDDEPLWDTPEFWARSEADELLRDYPNSDARALAISFERTGGSYDGDPEFARDIITELHKRADAGIRFWPEPALASLENEVRDALATAGAGPSGPDEERQAFWWQRM